MTQPNRFIVIDDDALNNKICRVCIEKMDKGADVVTFTDPKEGFDYVASEYARTDHAHNATLFLDINMPVMNGWEFLELFEKLAENVKNRLKIYILSSSVDKRDMEKAKENKNVVYYLIKPLTKETIALITFAQKKK
ncbi:response regulator [Flavipsychrobacter stenotrophus]|uniref:Response regulator n=1 Tax=Flavipsychrobacter stenotrophus TaxID=2077091 RepID=A0A2S7ST94_9BACT|nr:response regulator [Flavipsychrobacter stenotrophus]PQJ09815.1 response regulator [Flavipsychrobacter stenotrophus]